MDVRKGCRYSRQLLVSTHLLEGGWEGAAEHEAVNSLLQAGDAHHLCKVTLHRPQQSRILYTLVLRVLPLRNRNIHPSNSSNANV